jgi:predicted CopG family antitoxin
MADTDDVTIRIKRRLWRRLHQRKGPGDSFNDVIERELDELETLRDQLEDQEQVSERTRDDTDERRDDSAAESALEERVRRTVDSVTDSWQDSDERLATRREAARRVLRHAVETGDAVGKSSEIVTETRAELPETGQNEDTWWRKNVRNVLREVGTYHNASHGYRVDEDDLE